MKKLFVALLVLTLTMSTAMAGVPVKIGASPTPHAEILEKVVPLLAEKGFDLEVVVFNDYVLPNTATEEGEIDANYFQNQAYLDRFNAEAGTHLVSVIAMHYEPFGLYPGSFGGKSRTSLDDIEKGDKIAIPNDGTNEARALLLLEALGLIKLAEDKGIFSTVLDIVENPYELEIFETEAAQVPRALPDVAFGAINGNYALDNGLSVVTDSVGSESLDTINDGYVNFVVVKVGNEDAPFIEALREALNTDEIRGFIEQEYQGAVIAAF